MSGEFTLSLESIVFLNGSIHNSKGQSHQ